MSIEKMKNKQIFVRESVGCFERGLVGRGELEPRAFLLVNSQVTTRDWRARSSL